MTQEQTQNPIYAINGLQETLKRHHNISVHWDTSPQHSVLNTEFVDELTQSPLIKVKSFDDDIYSYNFTTKAFRKSEWNELSLIARGLFFRKDKNNDYHIVARSYAKSFNINEWDKPHMQLDALAAQIDRPVHAYLKENGFLGIVSYNPDLQKPFTSSKSSPNSEFTQILHRMLLEHFGHEEAFHNFTLHLHAFNATATFEIIEPNLDPHIITEAKPRLVLLDVIANTLDYHIMDRTNRERFAALHGLETKEHALTFKTQTQFKDFIIHGLSRYQYTYSSKTREKGPIEGYMFEFSGQDMPIFCKAKTEYYNFWKRQRTLINAIKRAYNTQSNTMPKAEDSLLAQRFRDFILAEKKPEDLDHVSIPNLRSEFFASSYAENITLPH